MRKIGEMTVFVFLEDIKKKKQYIIFIYESKNINIILANLDKLVKRSVKESLAFFAKGP
jgi:hypothetical protein